MAKILRFQKFFVLLVSGNTEKQLALSLNDVKYNSEKSSLYDWKRENTVVEDTS